VRLLTHPTDASAADVLACAALASSLPTRTVLGGGSSPIQQTQKRPRYALATGLHNKLLSTPFKTNRTTTSAFLIPLVVVHRRIGKAPIANPVLKGALSYALA
jgi:hypothetical protein